MTPIPAAPVSGGIFVVRIATTAPPPGVSLNGLQCAVHFDRLHLELLSADPVADGPFQFEIAEQIDNVAGTVRYAIGVNPGGSGLTTAAVLADLVFRVRPEVPLCGESSLARFQAVGPFITRFATGQGPIVPATASLPVVDLDVIAPVISGVPASVDVAADAGTVAGAFVPAPVLSAFDNCDASPFLEVLITLPDGQQLSAWPANGMFPVGTSAFSCTATDLSGNSMTEARTITVRDHQLLDVNVCFNGSVLGTSIRQLRVTAGGVPSVVNLPMSGGCGTALAVQVPVRADYPCMSFKDMVHSLSGSSAVALSGRRWSASVSLIQGDSSDDDKIDIIDFGLYLDDFGSPRPRNARSNFNGDTTVNNGDFAFIGIGFFSEGTPCVQGVLRSEPRSRVSVRELRREGHGHLAKADLNQDGWLDLADIELHLTRGAAPTGRGIGTVAGE